MCEPGLLKFPSIAGRGSSCTKRTCTSTYLCQLSRSARWPQPPCSAWWIRMARSAAGCGTWRSSCSRCKVLLVCKLAAACACIVTPALASSAEQSRIWMTGPGMSHAVLQRHENPNCAGTDSAEGNAAIQVSNLRMMRQKLLALGSQTMTDIIGACHAPASGRDR